MGAKFKPSQAPLKAPVLKQAVRALGRVCQHCKQIIEQKSPECLHCHRPINLKHNAVPHGWLHASCEDTPKQEAAHV